MNGAQSTGDPLRDWVIAESHVDATGHWRLLRHGGRRCDHWRDLKCPDDEKQARKLYDAECCGMRQGGLRLIAPDGRIAAARWTASLRTRW